MLFRRFARRSNAATLDMCSKCFRAHRQAHPEVAAAIAAAIPIPASAATDGAAAMLIDEPGAGDDGAAGAAGKKLGNRCAACKKKVGLHGFKCKCESVFCALHRYADAHACTFDYRAEARESLAKSNPAIRGEKVSRI